MEGSPEDYSDWYTDGMSTTTFDIYSDLRDYPSDFGIFDVVIKIHNKNNSWENFNPYLYFTRANFNILKTELWDSDEGWVVWNNLWDKSGNTSARSHYSTSINPRGTKYIKLKIKAEFDVQTDEFFICDTSLFGDCLEPWYNSSWTSRQIINLTNGSGAELKDYQVRININNLQTTFWNEIKSDANDLRFTDSDDNEFLNFWIEGWDYSNNDANVWVKIKSIPTGTNNIYMYFNNSTTTMGDYNRINDVMLGNTYNSVNWVEIDSGTINYDNNVWTITNGARNTNYFAYAKVNDNNDTNDFFVRGQYFVPSGSAYVGLMSFQDIITNPRSDATNNKAIRLMSSGTQVGIGDTSDSTTCNTAEDAWIFFQIKKNGNKVDGNTYRNNAYGNSDVICSLGNFTLANTLIRNVLTSVSTFEDGGVGDGDASVRNIIVGKQAELISYSFGAAADLNEIWAIQFLNEVDESVIVPTTFTIDGNSWASHISATGKIDINTTEAGFTNKEYTLIASLEGYTERTYILDINIYNNPSHILYLLDNNTGKSIDFIFYDADGNNILATADYNITYSSGYVAGGTTSSTGAETIFLNPNEDGYIINFETSSGEYISYAPVVLVNVLVPRNEEATQTTITPFDLSVSGLGYGSWTQISAAQSFYALTNTTGYYYVDINGTASFYPKTYFLNFKGEFSNYELQPYLTSVSTGYQTSFYVYNSNTLQTIENVLIESYKDINAVRTLMQSKETDATGKAVFSFVIDATYYIDFTYNGTIINTDDVLIRPSDDIIYVYLNLGTDTYTPTGISTTRIDFARDSSQVETSTDFDLNVSVFGSSVERIDVNWSTKGSIFATQTIVGAGDINQIILTTDVVVGYPIEMCVAATLEDDNVIRECQWYFIIPYDSNYNLIGMAGTGGELRSSLQCPAEGDCASLLLIALMITFGISAAAAGSVMRNDYKSVGILTAAVLGLFVFLGFVSMGIWVLAVVGMAFAYISLKGAS